MKKYLLLLAGVLGYAHSFSQDDALVIQGTKKISKKLTPQQVVDSLNKKFPDAKSVDYYKVSADAVKNGWTVTEQDNLASGAEVDYYTISFKREDMKYYALFDQEGKLVMSKLEEKVAELPEPIKQSIASLQQQYPGYTVISKTYYKNLNHSKEKEYYEVIAQKEKTKKHLFYNMDGTLAKVK
jgi:hypothetical protein